MPYYNSFQLEKSLASSLDWICEYARKAEARENSACFNFAAVTYSFQNEKSIFFDQVTSDLKCAASARFPIQNQTQVVQV